MKAWNNGAWLLMLPAAAVMVYRSRSDFAFMPHAAAA
jgi:hypothetical protein